MNTLALLSFTHGNYQGTFLELVERKLVDGQAMLIAEPLHVIIDLVCLRKVAWQGIDGLTEGFHIEPELLRS